MGIKQFFRAIFFPILNIFESGSDTYNYRPSHRYVLLFLGTLFSGLSILVLWLSQGEDAGYLLPVIIFGAVGFTCLLIGLIGNDRAVAKIWGGARK